MSPIILLDFDQTLFNHWAFAEWMDNFFVKRFGTMPSSFQNSFEGHHEEMPEGLRLYKHAGHIEQATGKSWAYVSGEIERACRADGKDFCYPEVHDVLLDLVKSREDVRILTFGDGEYQRFKISSCQLLRQSNIGIHVVREPKRIFLKREFPKSPGVLVDDKYPLNLPSNWLHIWITRHLEVRKPLTKQDGTIQISSLDQLTAALLI